MPTAPLELREKMKEYFGDPIDDSGPIKFLKERGFKLNRDWSWSKDGLKWGDLDLKEKICINFLVMEWDFGGFNDDLRRRPETPLR